MEIVLLLIIILILVFTLNNINAKLESIESDFKELKNSLNKLAIKKVETLENKPIEKANDLKKEPVVDAKITPLVVEIEKPAAVERPFYIEKPIETEEKPEKIASKTTYREEAAPPITPEVSWWDRFREQNPDLEKFVGENLISKIGVLILVLGISYFVKFAIDKNWINETARVGIGILCGTIVMGFAHKLRANYKAFSSVLVAGAVAIFYFTIAIAFHQYQLFSQTVAFILMVIITAFSVLISVSYNRMELAILSLIGGFAVPFMVSHGEGNYLVLFTYIAILDLGILAIAYTKRWSIVNVLALVFTAFLYMGWLETKVVRVPNAPYLGAFLFATLFYIIFTFANIINNLRTYCVFTKTELIVLVSNTFLYFLIGMTILSEFYPELKGLFTASLAFFNLVCAWFLFKKFGLDKNAIYLLIGLTLTFITLSIPLQFEGNYITLFWTAEAVLLLWLSQKSGIVHFRFTSVIVHVLAISSLMIDWGQVYASDVNIAPILLNGGLVAGLSAALSFFGVSFLTRNETETHTLFGIVLDSIQYNNCTKILGVVILYLAGFFEVSYQAHQYFTDIFSPQAITIAYHLTFSVALLLIVQKFQVQAVYKFVMGLLCVNVILYLLYFSSVPLGELRDNLMLTSDVKIAFFLHYISLACILYHGFAIWKDGKTVDSLSIFYKQWFIWAATFAIVFIASNEVLVHGIPLFATRLDAGNKDFSLLYNVYRDAHLLMLKVAFPILWGMFSFLFLTIGIQKQNRTLRIVALTLLGITILKLFIFDISNVSETGKIIAFILLGVVTLVMSFAYQKIKKIVLKDEKSEDIKNEEQ